MEVREPSAKYLARPGYKQTDLGVIPRDWDVVPMGQVGECLIGLTYSPFDVRDFGTLVLRSSNIQNGKLAFDDNVFVDMDVPARAITRKNDILICVRNGSRQLIGKCALIDDKTAGSAFGAFMSVLRSDSAKFLFFQFQSSILKRQIDEVMGATINQITNRDMASFKVIWPPTKSEQEAIAEALGDADALIESLEQLLVKKRHLKQGAMQELLTGKKRLPGFSGEWVVKRLGEITQPRMERVDPRRTGPHEFCIELEHIGQGTGCLVGYTVTSEDSSLKSIFRDGDVLFGKLRAYLRKYWLANRGGVCSTEIWVLMAKCVAVIPEYLFQLVMMDRFIEVASTAYGTHMPRSDWNVVKNYEVQLPKIEEQTAIAAILSDMDAEITALETKLTKARSLKQGMMQELLTGRIRLV